MGRMAIDEHGNRVPIESLMSPEDLEAYKAAQHLKRKKKTAVQEKLDQIDGVKSPDAAPPAPISEPPRAVVLDVNTGKPLPCPEGTVPCEKMDVECGLRKEHYCLRAPGQPCDFDIELNDTLNGVQRPTPRGNGEERELDLNPRVEAPRERTSAELRAAREKHASRFDALTVKELKAKCDKLGVAYAQNTQKKTLIKRLKEELDGGAESPGSKL